MDTYPKNLMKTLLDLLADQNGVKIEYKMEENGCETEKSKTPF